MFFLLRRPKYLLAAAAAASLMTGVHGLWEAAAYAHPHAVTTGQFEEHLPGDGWYHITGGILDMTQSIVLTKNGQPVDDSGQPGSCYVALHSPDDPANSPARIFVRSTDPATIASASAASVEVQSMSDPQNEAYIAANKTLFYPQADVTGSVELTSDDRSAARAYVSVFVPGAAENFVIVDEGRRPGSPWSAISLVGLGLMLGAISYFLLTGAEVPAAGKEFNWSPDEYREPSVGPPPAPYGSFPPNIPTGCQPVVPTTVPTGFQPAIAPRAPGYPQPQPYDPHKPSEGDDEPGVRMRSIDG